LSDCAQISKHAGGIGLSIHKIRAENSPIAGTNGKSNGLIPLLRVFNSTVRYVDQGGGKRKGTVAIYLEPWHPDILDVLDAKKNTGAEEQRTRDLFYALWVPDLFMKRVENNGTWSLFCPSECPGLYETTGKEFETLYEQYEMQNKARNTIPAQTLFTKIISSQIETGTPYILYKDTINKTSNQQNLGTIKSSNLCAEICQYTDHNEIAVCNLASICLPKFVQGTKFNYELLRSVTKTIVRNLNKIIDKTYYPVKEARVSNQKHRPMGIGIQGLADVFAMLHISFDSDKAQELNRYIMETIYFSALSESNKISQTIGSYESFKGSPLSYGKFHFDMYSNFSYSTLSKKWDWEELRTKIIKHGVRNSLCVALMPTASTSQIMGNNDAFEPFSSNIYTRRLLSGEFVVINKHLIKDLLKLNLWTEHMKNKLIEHNGSVHKLDIPEDLKNIYKTAFEISPKSIIQMAKDRQFFVDQSQSMNLFIDTPSIAQLANIHMYSWKQGLKTGIYYLRTKPAVNAVKVTLPPSVPPSSMVPPLVTTLELEVKPPSDVNFICDSEKGICFSCSS
jgi:ribonucleoside-diphosphate reductase alpha chain